MQRFPPWRSLPSTKRAVSAWVSSVSSSSRNCATTSTTSEVRPPTASLERLATVCSREIRLETLRDEEAGASAVSPMIPPGWTLQHRPGDSFFVLNRSRRSTSSSDADELLVVPDRRYRSRAEAATQKLVDQRRLPSSRAPVQRPASSAAPLHAEIDVSVFCPMRVKDPSLIESTIDLSEYAPFDVLVRKPLDRTDLALYLSLASVDSELRVRGVQLLSPTQLSVFLPEASACTSFNLSGDYYRQVQCYGGPVFTDLSKPMAEEMLQYIECVVGITPVVREYICQMLFTLEQESYVRWLAQLAAFGGGVKSAEALPNTKWV